MAAKKKAAKKGGKKATSRTERAARAADRQVKKTVRMEVPTLGRVVLFGGGDAPKVEPMPGMIVRGSDNPRGNISIMVLHEAGSSRALDVPYSGEPKAGSWWWPERVEAVEVPVDE